LSKCPGAVQVRIEVKRCPHCGGEVELFTDEYKAKCPNCGEMVFRDLDACIDWCPYARKCLEEREKTRGKETP